MINIALYQPDIPQNLGAMMRLCACMGVQLHIIEPCGFPFDARKIRRAGMDYIDHVRYERHADWHSFQSQIPDEGRIILMTTKASVPYTDFTFKEGDILLAGSESAGAPQHIHDAVDARVRITMNGAMRSLNIVNATSMILGEGLRQTHVG